MRRMALATGLIGAPLLACGREAATPQAETTDRERYFDHEAIAALAVGMTEAEILEEYGPPQAVRVDEDGSRV